MGALDRRIQAGRPQCLLLKLPGELRNQIYRLLLPAGVTLRGLGGGGKDDQGMDKVRFLRNDLEIASLLLVSRQIHVEALAMIYKHSRFSLSISERMWASVTYQEDDFKKAARQHLRNALVAISRFEQVTISLCMESSAFDTPFRTFESLWILLSPIQKAFSSGKHTPRIVDLHVCLHLWRGDVHWGGAPRRRDLMELLNVMEAHKGYLVAHCVVPKPLASISWMRYHYDVNNQDVAMELEFLQSECSMMGIKLDTTHVEAPACIPALPLCLPPS